MKRYSFLAVVLLVLLFSVSAIAGDLSDNLDVGFSTGHSQLDLYNRLVDAKNDINALEKMDVIFTTGDFLQNDGTTIAQLTSSTVPGLEIDNSIGAIVWADGETTPASVTFRVPNGYSSGGKFYVFADQSNSTTPPQIDFNVYTNRTGVIFDSATSNQSPVSIIATADPGTPVLVTLTPATDFASLAAGDIVTLNIWRDDTLTGTADLEVYYAGFARTS